MYLYQDFSAKVACWPWLLKFQGPSVAKTLLGQQRVMLQIRVMMECPNWFDTSLAVHPIYYLSGYKAVLVPGKVVERVGP